MDNQNSQAQGPVTLTLEPNSNPQQDAFNIGAMPTQAVANINVGVPSGHAAGTIDESMLSDEERAQVDQFAREIDIANSSQVSNYGSNAQRNISAFSSSMLKQVRTLELGDVGESLKELRMAIDATTEPEKRGILGIFQKAKRGVTSIVANYQKAETNVNKVEKDLQSHQVVLTKDIVMYDQMYKLNLKYYKEITMYIIAGKKALEEAVNGRLQELKAIAAQTQKQEDAEAARDFESQCNRFEKKLEALEITRTIAIQQAPQIRMIQDNDKDSLEKIQLSLSNTIPLWRNQLVISLGIEHSRRAVDAQAALSEKTNELLAQNAQMLHQATVDIARESDRPIVEMETLRQCNKELISSINEVIKIHEEGSKKRQETHGELVKIEEELKQALLEAANR